MKNMYLIFFILSVFALDGCYNSVALVSVESNAFNPRIDIDRLIYDSPPRFIDRSLDKIQLPKGILSNLAYGDKVIIQCLNQETLADTGMRSAVDRALVSKLLSGRVKVLDRDKRILGQILADSGSSENSLWYYYIAPTRDSSVGLKSPTSILHPTKILAYRILDLGIAQSVDRTKYDIYRFGVAELELRLIDVPTSQILYSGIVTNVVEDTITNSEYLILSKMHFRYYYDDIVIDHTITENQPDFLIDPGLAIGNITFNFKEGRQVAYAYIAETNIKKIVKKIRIPADNPGSTFSYTWDFTNDQAERIKPGDYVLLLNDSQVHTFHVGK
ncbi:MAG: hypothetical protein ACP5US_11960 [Candidatus Kryptoniota bacterium]